MHIWEAGKPPNLSLHFICHFNPMLAALVVFYFITSDYQMPVNYEAVSLSISAAT